ncbi:hypothetical protein [Flavobacterium chungangense]|uniref:hypothetical protein n=1 Tax=Flavobacterium chungangense TaxID=554283 RepID=UPI0004DF3CC1|nr:hypothetical protein [Flavobacterium chungangense]
MNFGLTADIHWETKVDISLGLVPQREFRDFFYSKNYGTDINKFVVVLMCRNSEYNFKQRIRFIKKEKALYMDIMLDFLLRKREIESFLKN